MCPLCIATVGLMVSGAAAFVRKVRARSEQERLDADRREGDPQGTPAPV
ncbi:hypothetical protein [Actinopolymorpha rutila]|uniref:Uncharacterized protein n=1 Tax=Actinopolymorpha rutila TaxID=446787 RepID=A0A852ZH23_9ACTN|nr:hypothetical protein [Actinopolymorpha rutila]NYH88899.1 hypothetical protein [Actinopolymorpha rutila]